MIKLAEEDHEIQQGKIRDGGCVCFMALIAILAMVALQDAHSANERARAHIEAAARAREAAWAADKEATDYTMALRNARESASEDSLPSVTWLDEMRQEKAQQEETFLLEDDTGKWHNVAKNGPPAWVFVRNK